MKTKQWLIVPAVVVLASALGGCSESDETTVDVGSAVTSAAPASNASTATSTTTATSTVTSTTTTTTQTPIGGDIVAPITTEANDLQGTTVDLVVGQVLNIRTGSLPVDSYRGEVANGAIASFAAGYSDGSAQFNPGVTALAPGATEVTLTNVQGGIAPVTFIVTVTPRQ